MVKFSYPAMKLFIQTFGCQMNVADSEEMADHFFRKGFIPTATTGDADVILLNTCTVRQHAEDKAFSQIGRYRTWKNDNPERVLVVAGCMAERLRHRLQKRFPHVDLVIGAKRIDEFAEIMGTFLKSRAIPVGTRTEGRNGKVAGFDWFRESKESFGAGSLRASGEPFVLGDEQDTALVTIMRGCNYSCSYCIVPFVRGREIYRSPETVLEEVRERVGRGATKVMLLGQTVNSYWHREEKPGGGSVITDFPDLVRKVNAIPGVGEIRFMSPHPHYMSDKLIRTLSECEKSSNEIHLPVQSGSNRILGAMKRNYTRESYLATVSKLRKAIPLIKLGTDFIVGFPGETEEDFAQTLSLAEEIHFSAAYCFKYSSRKGTESSQLRDDVPRATKEKRLSVLLEKVKGSRLDPTRGAAA